MWKLSKISADEALTSLSSDGKLGLISMEASLRQKIHGENELPKEEKVLSLLIIYRFCKVYV